MDAQQTKTTTEHKSKDIHLKANHLSPFMKTDKSFFYPYFSVIPLRDNFVSTQRHKTDLLWEDSRQQ